MNLKRSALLLSLLLGSLQGLLPSVRSPLSSVLDRKNRVARGGSCWLVEQQNSNVSQQDEEVGTKGGRPRPEEA